MPIGVGAALLLACAPQTDLLGMGTEPVGSGPVAVATATLIDPSAGAGAVPLNLAAILVRFPTSVSVLGGALPAGSLGLRSSDGQAVGADQPMLVDCPLAGPGTCFRCALTQALLPSTTYQVSVDGGITDTQGNAVPVGPVAQFSSGADMDVTPPAIGALTVTPSGPCALVEFQTDEPAAGSLWLRGDGLERHITAGAGVTRFSVAASLAVFGAGNDVQLVARAVDLAGNVAETAAVSLAVPAGLLSLAITEVMANAAGAEPAQEFVELRNLGTTAADISGLTLEDTKGSDSLPPALVEPGAYALVVPAGFDPASPVDVPPRPGTTLIRVDARLGGDGLANGGEAVRLRNAAGTILSSYGGYVDVSATKWAGRGVHRVPQDACDQAASWTHIPVAATPGWGPP